MIYTGNRSMTAASYEPELARWLTDRSQDADCIADRARRETGLNVVDEAYDDPDSGCWIVTWNEGIDCEICLGSYGLSDDDLETLTII